MRQLYGAAHHAFVSERKALATALRAEGETALARRILKRTRPPVAVWVVNQLAQTNPQALSVALLAIDAERDAQLDVLGGGDAGQVADARAASREAQARLRVALSVILEEGGHAASKTNLDRALEVLRNGALDAELRSDLEAGVLGAAPEPPDLGAVAKELDPALLRAALQKQKKPQRPRRRGIDSFMAKAVRGKQARAPEKTTIPAAPQVPAPTTPARRPVVDEDKIAALETELLQRLAEAEDKATEVERLTNELDLAREELRRMKRRAGDLKERLATLRRRAKKAT